MDMDTVPGYVRKPYLRCARTKDRDAENMRFCRRISHYRVVRDARPSTAPISIHWRRAKSERVANYNTHPIHALRVRASNLIPGWAPYDTNMRHTQGRASPITKKSDTCFILERRRLNCWLVSLVSGTNRRCIRVSYLIPSWDSRLPAAC
jgi:hypothetical protein